MCGLLNKCKWNNFFDILKKYDFSRFWLNFFFLKKI